MLGYRESSIGKITTRCLAALSRELLASGLVELPFRSAGPRRAVDAGAAWNRCRLSSAMSEPAQLSTRRPSALQDRGAGLARWCSSGGGRGAAGRPSWRRCWRATAGRPWGCRWPRWRARRSCGRPWRAAREVGVRWLVASGRPDRDRIAEAERWLLPRAAAGARHRPAAGAGRPPPGILPPQEMLLDRPRDRRALAPPGRRRSLSAGGASPCERRPTAGTGRSAWRSNPPAAWGSTRRGRRRCWRSPPCAPSSATRCWTPSPATSATSCSTRRTPGPPPEARGRRPGSCWRSAACGSRGRSGTACRGSSPPRSTASAGGAGRRRARRVAAGRSRGAARPPPRPSTSWAFWAAPSPGSGTRRGSGISTGGSAAPSRCSPSSPPRPGSRRGARS